MLTFRGIAELLGVVGGQTWSWILVHFATRLLFEDVMLRVPDYTYSDKRDRSIPGLSHWPNSTLPDPAILADLTEAHIQVKPVNLDKSHNSFLRACAPPTFNNTKWPRQTTVLDGELELQ